MHIPKCNTSEIPVLSFQEALITRDEISYDPNRWIYIPNFYSEYRYVLGTKGKKPLICIGINPSTAAPDRLDRTLQSVERIAHFNGFDSFLMMNVYAQRATDPNHMEKECNAVLHSENLNAFSYVMDLCEGSPCIWAAWGTLIEKRPYLKDCVLDMVHLGLARNARWFTVGQRSVKGGHPHHPLYLKKDSCIEPFDIENYLR